MPIDYWDYLGWKDTLADSRFSARQNAYSHMRGDREVYTPQVVVNGSTHVIGSDRASIEGAINDTGKADGVMSVPVTMTLSGKQLNVSVAASKVPSAAAHGEVWICSISKSVPIAIGRGENRGQEVTYHNVVRNLLKVGDWNGSPGSWTVPLENISREGVDAAVVYVQDGSREKPGADARCGLHVAALVCSCRARIAIRDIARAEKPSGIRSLYPARFEISSRVAASASTYAERHPTNEKGPTLVGPVSGLTPCEQARS